MNEFIVWDKLKKCFANDVCCDVRLLKNDISYSLEIRDELFELFYPVGIKDTKQKTIYAESSIFEFYFNNVIEKGYFQYSKTSLRYFIRLLNGQNIDYNTYLVIDLNVIDTIQENKLGLIK